MTIIPGRRLASFPLERLAGWLGALRPRTVGLSTCLLIWVVGAAVAGNYCLYERARLLEQAREDLAAVSVPAAGFVERELGTLNIVVSLAIADFHRGELDLAGVYGRLLQQADKFDQLAALHRVLGIDADGIVRYSPFPGRIGMDVSDRSYFVRLRDGHGPGLVVGEPVTSRAAPHQRLVPFGWALTDSAAKFAGVIAVAASWQPYATFFANLTNGPEQTVALIDGAGRLYALDALHWDNPNEEPLRPLFLKDADSPNGLPAGAGMVGGYLVDRADVPGVDLHVVSGIPLTAILQAWWVQVHIVTGLVLVIGVAAGILTGLLHRTLNALRTTAVTAATAAADARAAQGRAEAGERSQAQFLAAMSHEIRTPMTGVLGMADLLAAETLTSRQQAYVQTIQTSGQHLLGVINDVLDFSRLGAGGLTLERIDFSLVDVLEQVRSIMAPQAVERGLELTFTVQHGVPPILLGDPTRLRQLLVNLIGNGLKFTARGGVGVTVGGTLLSDELVTLRFEVADSGIGISAAQQALLFRPFTQADLSTSRHYGGSGLGLAICRELVLLMGGGIGVDSEPDRGSRFWFEVPLGIGHTVAPQERASATAATPSPLRVLVAEDVAVNRDLLETGLTHAGHQVSLATNGAEAVAMLSRQRFDVVLMDVQMPVLDGIEATRRIRALPPPVGTVPILALTASLMEAERRHCLAAGMNRVLGKPIVWPELLAALAELKPSVAAGEPSPTAIPVMDTAADPAPSGAEVNSVGVPVPDLDHALITGMTRQLPPAVVARLLRQGLDGASRSSAELQEAVSDPVRLQREAHRLRGTAGSFGLARLSALAGSIEDRASRGLAVVDLVGELAQATTAARTALDELDLAPVPSHRIGAEERRSTQARTVGDN
ncbi:MAG: ATP-binding protein [Geminicoccaceae bacterium]